MKTAYRVKHVKTGLFFKKNPRYSGGHRWHEEGTTWNKLSHVKLAFREGSLKGVSLNDVSILEYEVVTVPLRIVPVSEMKETKR